VTIRGAVGPPSSLALVHLRRTAARRGSFPLFARLAGIRAHYNGLTFPPWSSAWETFRGIHGGKPRAPNEFIGDASFMRRQVPVMWPHVAGRCGYGVSPAGPRIRRTARRILRRPWSTIRAFRSRVPVFGRRVPELHRVRRPRCSKAKLPRPESRFLVGPLSPPSAPSLDMLRFEALCCVRSHGRRNKKGPLPVAANAEIPRRPDRPSANHASVDATPRSVLTDPPSLFGGAPPCSSS